MNEPINHTWRGRVSLLAITFFALALVVLGLGGIMSQAKAGPVTLTFNSGQVSFGAVINDRQVLPATSKFPSPMLPVPQRTDIQLVGTQSGNKISFPTSLNSGAQFPYMNFTNPADLTQMVPFTFRMLGSGLNGTFDASTGKAELKGKIDIDIVTGQGPGAPDPLTDLAVPPLGLFSRCAIHNVPVDFSTETRAPFTAARYKGGLTGKGSMATSISDLPKAVAEHGSAAEDANCTLLDQIIHHAVSGIWLANGISKPPPQPPVKPSCETDFRLCPAPRFANINDITLTPHRKKVKAGKKIKLVAHVTNSGNIRAKKVKVRFKSSNRRVKVPKTRTISVAASTTKKVKFRARVKRTAKGGAAIRVAAHGFSAVSAIRIKAKK